MAIHSQARTVAPQVRYEYDMFGWSAGELVARRDEFLESETDHDLIISDCEHALDRPFIFEVASSGYGPADVNAILECFLLHTRVLVDFLIKEPKGDDVSAKHYFEDEEEWTQLKCPEHLDYQRLNKTLAHLTYKRSEYGPHNLWNITQIRREVESIWKSFWDKLPSERREWFESYLDPGERQLLCH